ncbi:FkbM family methyltransferase [Patescibacteria group bacterium]|nr:MAG: FkbM family methyltransferase [Patescibacteria group bacterium]
MKIFIRDDADQSVYNEIFKLGEYRAADKAIKNAREPVIDVGAHAGFFSLYCRALNPQVKIFAIEPEPENFKQLQKHIAGNNIKGVEPVPAALAGETGERELIISKDNHNHRLRLPPPRLPLIKGEDNFPPLDKGRAREGYWVAAFSLGDFCRRYKIKNVALLKMDIEGGEEETFKSASASDLAMVKNVILEYHGNNFAPIEQKLRENGFGVQKFPSKFDNKMGFLFARNKRYVSPSMDSGG